MQDRHADIIQGNSFTLKPGKVRKPALTILDAACIYGRDLPSLPYKQR